MKRRRTRPTGSSHGRASPPGSAGEGQLRIVGGQFRGRRLTYSGDPRVRPMKDRTREAVFNLLGPGVRGTQVWDLFAGTGAMGLEAMSRGAAGATLIERHIPTAKVIQQNVATLELQDRVTVVRADVFSWRASWTPGVETGSAAGRPWVIFCCPPYALYEEQLESLRDLLASIRQMSPPGSMFVVEAETPFDFTTLWPGDWATRDYPPAAIGIDQTPGGE